MPDTNSPSLIIHCRICFRAFGLIFTACHIKSFFLTNFIICKYRQQIGYISCTLTKANRLTKLWLRIEVVWDVTPCRWIIDSQRLERTSCLHFQWSSYGQPSLQARCRTEWFGPVKKHVAGRRFRVDVDVKQTVTSPYRHFKQTSFAGTQTLVPRCDKCLYV